MPVESRVSAEVNWPVVVGVGIIAVFAFYLLYSVNQVVQNVEQATTTPLANLESGVGNFLHYLNPFNWFSSTSSDDSSQ